MPFQRAFFYETFSQKELFQLFKFSAFQTLKFDFKRANKLLLLA